MNAAVRRALAAVAGELQVTMASLPGWAAAEGAVGARASDLQRALCSGLQAQLGAVACIEGPLPAGVKEHWAGWLGRADVLARLDNGDETYFETQLCGVEKLYESLWDALKLALFTALAERRAGYLLYAAPESAWERDGQHPQPLFEDGTLWVAELLRSRCQELWTWCLTGTRTTRPIALPAELRSTPIANATIRSPGVDWELRCVRIEGSAASGWIAFDESGWPALEQPVGAAGAGSELAAEEEAEYVEESGEFSEPGDLAQQGEELPAEASEPA